MTKSTNHSKQLDEISFLADNQMSALLFTLQIFTLQGSAFQYQFESGKKVLKRNRQCVTE